VVPTCSLRIPIVRGRCSRGGEGRSKRDAARTEEDDRHESGASTPNHRRQPFQHALLSSPGSGDPVAANNTNDHEPHHVATPYGREQPSRDLRARRRAPVPDRVRLARARDPADHAGMHATQHRGPCIRCERETPRRQSPPRDASGQSEVAVVATPARDLISSRHHPAADNKAVATHADSGPLAHPMTHLQPDECLATVSKRGEPRQDDQ
jgi:hypothetical protein